MDYNPFKEENISFNSRQVEQLQEPRDDYFHYPNEGSHLRIFDPTDDDDDYLRKDLLFGEVVYKNVADRHVADEVRSQAMSLDQDMFPRPDHEMGSNNDGESPTANSARVFDCIPEEQKCQPEQPKSKSELPNGLRSVFEIPERYRHIFAGYPCFNSIQSKVMNDLLHSDKPVVVAAPTGSGKTVLFEMAIVRFLQSIEERGYHGDFKIVYMAPVKALCSERYHDWSAKLAPLNITCREVTGDSDTNDYFELRDFRVLLTTPEKWDSLTRKWRDHKSLVQVVKLFLIDEVHLLNEERRGPTMEAVVSRMKTVQHSLELEHVEQPHELPHGVRFVAVSATIPNIEDVAEWLSNSSLLQAASFKMGEEERPVPLKKVVFGYSCQNTWSPFRFDLSLTYKLKSVLFKFAEGKPALIFCSTRKGVQQTVAVLVQDITFTLNPHQRREVDQIAPQIKDSKIRESVLRGVGCHHAGMDAEDRHATEDLFRRGMLPVLVATSTLAMGVNLPAHLVVIKSTEQYESGVYREYSESQLLQMMGRAGRPQFDTSATAVIMTKDSLKSRYEKLVTGHQMVESSLHRHLPEHLNAEVVLQTIKNLDVAMDWVRSTFLYVRALREPVKYGVAGYQREGEECTRNKIETRLHELCMRELNALASCELVELAGMAVLPTPVGRLMARYYMALDSMKTFMQLTGDEILPEILAAVSRCAEFSEVQIRANERRALNMLNRCKDRQTIRFPLPGKIKGRDMKVNVLSQAFLDNIPMPDPALHQENVKVIRIGQRVTKCLAEFMAVKRPRCYCGNLWTTLLAKNFYCRMWHDSRLVSKQLERIGPALATQLAAAGKSSFNAIKDANPRDLERILNRAPPLGNVLQNAVTGLPRYSLHLQAEEVSPYVVHVSLELSLDNIAALEVQVTAGERHAVVVLLAEQTSNILLHRERVSDQFLMRGKSYVYETEFKQPKDEEKSTEKIEVIAHVISETWAGLDVEKMVRIIPRDARSLQQTPMPTPRLTVAPRNLKAALQKYVRQHAVKKTMIPTCAASAAVNESTTLTLVPSKQAASSTPEASGESRSSVVDQIRAKYGQLPVLPLYRLGHQREPGPTTESANEADEYPAELPGACATIQPSNSKKINTPSPPSMSPTLSEIQSVGRSPSPSFSPSYSPLSSPVRPISLIRRRDEVLKLNFDLGIEDLLADTPCTPREVKRSLPIPVSRPIEFKHRRLSPPREHHELKNLVTAVMGTYTGPPILPSKIPSVSVPHHERDSSSPFPLVATSPPRRVALSRASPHWSPGMRLPQYKNEAQTEDLEHLSPCSLLGATLAEPYHESSREVTCSLNLEKLSRTSPEPALPTLAKSWTTPSPPKVLPPAPQWQTRNYEKKIFPDNLMSFKFNYDF